MIPDMQRKKLRGEATTQRCLLHHKEREVSSQTNQEVLNKVFTALSNTL